MPEDIDGADDKSFTSGAEFAGLNEGAEKISGPAALAKAMREAMAVWGPIGAKKHNEAAGIDSATENFVEFESVPRLDIDLGEIDQIIPRSMVVEPENGITSFLVETFSDGSPFAFEADEERPMGFVGYEVVVRDGQRPMMVPYGPMGDYEPYEPEDSKDYFKKMLEGYLHAAAKGDVPQPYELTDEQCAALAKFIEENTDSLKEKVGSA